MNQETYSPRELTASEVSISFSIQRYVILRGALDSDSARLAFTAFESLMQDTDRLQQYPYDDKTKFGYIPPGTETLQHNREYRGTTRAMFDLGPDTLPHKACIARLYCEVVSACRQLLQLLDAAGQHNLARLPVGAHRIRLAKYLLSGVDSGQELFPSHRDFSLLTAFIGSDAEGLEVRVQEVWRPVRLAYGDLLIAAGTPLYQFDSDWKALQHRVVGGTDNRLSAFMFYELDENVVLPKSGETYGDMLARVMRDTRL